MKNCFVFKNMRKCTFSLLCLCACITVLFLVFGGIREIGAESSSPHVNPGDNFQSLKKNTGKRTTVPCFGNIPLYFIPNQGQMDSPALFCAKTPGYTLWLTREGLVFDSMKKVKVKSNREVSRLIFLKANQDPVIVPEQPTPHRVNYFKGSNKSQWCKSVNIPTSRAVRYKSLYKKIDLKVYGHEKQVEYDWIVKPGGNPGDIGFRYQGVKRVSLDETGNLVVRTAFGRWVHQKPRAYQVIDGKQQVVNVVFKKKPGKNTYGFNVGPYHKDYELVIDPLVVVLSSYLGGSGYDGIYAMALDNSKAIYVAGYTLSMDFPTGSGFQDTHAGDYDAFVSKLSPDGKNLVFSTYLGGGFLDEAYGLAVDGSGAVYVGGRTVSTDFPIISAYQSTFSGPADGFITKLSADGSTLVYSTYLGGEWDDVVLDIVVNGSNELFAVGLTSSPGFPLQDAFQSEMGGGMSQDGFITKLSSSGGSLVFSSYLGGSGWDKVNAAVLDASGSILVVGETDSTDFPTVNPYQGSLASVYMDGFITKVSADGSSIVYSTYLGGNKSDYISDVTLDTGGAIYVCGRTDSIDFPTTSGAFQDIDPNGSSHSDAFITKLSASGSDLIYSTYLGCSDCYTQAHGIAVGAGGSAFVTGYSDGTGFPLVDPFRDWGSHAYLSELTPDGSSLNFSSYLEFSVGNFENDIALDSSGAVYISGTAYSDGPAYNGYQVWGAGGYDGFVEKWVYSSFAKITLTSPNGGENWEVDSNRDITWTAPDTLENVKIEYSTNFGGEWKLVNDSAPNTGTYSWTVPDDPSQDCLVRISDPEPISPIPADESDNPFTIPTPPRITVWYPNGSEILFSTNVHEILWDSFGDITDVSIDYSTDGGGSWLPVVGSTANTGSYNWKVPGITSTNCLIRISNIEGTITDASDDVFTIRPSQITLTAPNGGENWHANLPYQITWTADVSISNISLEYSFDNGNSWSYIQHFSTHCTSFHWMVPNTPSSLCLVRVSDTGGANGADTSDAVFTILPPPIITVTAPNGGENWEGGTNHNITWTNTGTIDQMMIEYSTDNGTNWNLVAYPIPNTGTFNWTVPNTPSGNCLVRISDFSGGIEDFSDAVFTIQEQRTITVTAPNGGEDWSAYSFQDITWTSTGAIGSVNIQYSTDNGATWDPVITSTSNTGTYNWEIPYDLSTVCQVSISDTAGPAIDTSDTVFTISKPKISQSERDALIALYNSTNGDGWTINTNWRKPGNPTEFNDPGTEDTWYGITLNEDHVNHIQLSNNNLNGTLPDPSDLTLLEVLTLDGNNLSGNIPTTLNTMTQLTTLDLYGNQLSGTIPDLSSLTQLQQLKLGSNNLTGSVPAWINNLVNLTALHLGGNDLTGTIPDLSNLTLLSECNLSDNQLTGTIPPWFNQLTNLNSLRINDNQLTGTIPDMSNLSGLAYFYPGANQLSGTVPAWLNSLTNLKEIDIGSNQLTGTIPDLGGLTLLESLRLSGNQLTGNIPAGLGSLGTLTGLYLGGNQLSGGIPSELGNLTALHSLYLENNQLSGTIPGDLGNLTNLNYLYLNGNQLAGSIPDTLNNLTNLFDALGLNISWNGLYTANETLKNFLDSKQVGGNWESTQTTAPEGVSTGEETYESVKVSWAPILYQADPGGYRVYSSTTSGSGYTLAGSTADKSVDNYIVTGLEAETTYYFVVEAFTDSHAQNSNTITSPYSVEVSTATTQAPSITVTAPNGGQSWEGATSQAITWNSTGPITDVKIEYSTDNGGSWSTVIASTPNNGTYDWTVPNTPSTNCLVKITDIGGLAEDTSDAVFTIAEQRTITVAAPNGSENWEGGTNQNITWNSTGSIPNVKIEYSTDNGGAWNIIAAATANSGSYNWTVLNTPSTNCLVKVSDTAGPASDTSDAVFTILEQRTLTVLTPNGSENWEGGTNQNITWNSTGSIANVMIEYSTDSGSSWSTIIGSTADSGSYNWTVPNGTNLRLHSINL